MKDATTRDMFAASAMEALLIQKIVAVPADLAWSAYGYADAMMAQRGKEKRDHELEELRAQVGKLTTEADILRSMLTPGQSAPAIALEQLWELLEASNQTDAVINLHELFAKLSVANEHSHD